MTEAYSAQIIPFPVRPSPKAADGRAAETDLAKAVSRQHSAVEKWNAGMADLAGAMREMPGRS